MHEDISKQNEMKELYRSWSIDQLIRAFTVHKNDYTQDALDCIKDELDRRSVSPQEALSSEVSVKQTVEEEKKKWIGIKGFLLLFVLILAVQSISTIIVSIRDVLNGENPSKILLLPVGIYGLYVLYLLLLKRNNAPLHVQRWLGALCIACLLIIGLTILINPNRLENTFIVNPIGALIWLAYFSYSKRVKATYSATLTKTNLNGG